MIFLFLFPLLFTLCFSPFTHYQVLTTNISLWRWTSVKGFKSIDVIELGRLDNVGDPLHQVTNSLPWLKARAGLKPYEGKL